VPVNPLAPNVWVHDRWELDTDDKFGSEVSSVLSEKHDQPATDNITEAMTTTTAAPDSELVPVDPDPGHLATVRVALVVEAVLLIALGGWGLGAALTERAVDRSGAAVLVFHFTWQHAVLLWVIALIALLGTLGHSWAMRCTTVQAVGCGILFIVGAGHLSWFSNPADDVLHGVLALVGLTLLMWTAARALTDRPWVRRSGHRSPA
jgi:hypothetical protein